MEQAATYYSEGTKISATLYRPDGIAGRLVPCVVLCHGFTGIKELILPDYARRFASAGFAALAFDYRGFGASEGERGRLLWRDQVQDVRNSITFAQTLEGIDPERIALWGTSYGAANVIYAAGLDERPKCVVAQVGFGDGGRRLKTRSAEELAPLRQMIANERRKRVLTGERTMVDPFMILADPESKAFFENAAKDLPGLKTQVTLETLEAILEYEPEAVADRIAPRALLLLAAELDTVTPPDEFRSVFARAGEPKKLVILPGIRHYEIYKGEPLERSAREAIDWFTLHL
ncbi:MAG: alpha/beta fold hydrolase [Chloroflexi bacterium]|nr:alpha/beta fold hydrolase [Chloroflexota bacterium]